MKPDIMHQSWYNKLTHKFEDGTLTKIRQEIGKAPFSPENPKHVFRAFDLPLEQVRVVIVGLSPYMDDNACGYAFATMKSQYKDWPYSLKVIADSLCKEYQMDVNTIDDYLPSDLVLWQMQGVMMLNIALTTTKTDSKSHIELWKPFMIEVFKVLAVRTNLIFYFMGNDAYEYAKYLDSSHFIYRSMNPEMLKLNKDLIFTELEFDGHFYEVGEKYKEVYGTTLDWVLPF